MLLRRPRWVVGPWYGPADDLGGTVTIPPFDGGPLAGAPGDDGPSVVVLERALEGAALWGLELDPRYRVLAATIEPLADAGPWELPEDRRIQLLCFPVSTILASLRRTDVDPPEQITFDIEQLVDVSAGFGGAALEAPLFGRPQPAPGEWGPAFSLQGGSSAPDGRTQTATFAVEDDEARLEVFARFDAFEVRDEQGEELLG